MMETSETVQYNRLFLRDKHSSLFYPTGSNEDKKHLNSNGSKGSQHFINSSSLRDKL